MPIADLVSLLYRNSLCTEDIVSRQYTTPRNLFRRVFASIPAQLSTITMAPKRKSAAPRTSSRQSSSQQSTLSFHGKNNRVTKPSTLQEIKAEKKDPALLESVVRADEKADPSPDQDESTQDAIEHEAQPTQTEALADPLTHSGESTKAEDVLGGRAPQSDSGAVGGKASGWVSDEEQQARKVSETQIKRYWRAKEQERLAPRLHQEDMSVYERILREWDMSGQYGVSLEAFSNVFLVSFLEDVLTSFHSRA